MKPNLTSLRRGGGPEPARVMVAAGLIAAFFTVLLYLPASAEMTELSDSELSGYYSQGFSFQIVGESTIRLNVDAMIETIMGTDGLRLGGDGPVPYPPSGSISADDKWDQHWHNFRLGDHTSWRDTDRSFEIGGLWVEAEFDNLDNPTALYRLEIGTDHFRGPLYGDFVTLSGYVDVYLNVLGVPYRATFEGHRTTPLTDFIGQWITGDDFIAGNVRYRYTFPFGRYELTGEPTFFKIGIENRPGGPRNYVYAEIGHLMNRPGNWPSSDWPHWSEFYTPPD